MTDAAAIRTTAKAIFCKTYGYPRMTFRSIGREAFRWAMNEAKRRAAHAERIAAIPTDVKEKRIAELRDLTELAQFNVTFRSQQTRAAMLAEIESLS